MVRALADIGRFHRRRTGRVVVLVLLAAGVAVGALVAAAGFARADGSWTSTQGSFTLSSNPGDCTGSGSATIVLNDTGSGLSGYLTVTMGSIDASCAWAFFSGTLGTALSGSMNSDSSGFTATDSEGDSFTGTYSGSTLTVQMVPGGGSSGGGGTCAEYCDTVFTFTFTGSGDLFGAGFDVLSTGAAILGGVLGLAGLAAVASTAGPLPNVPKGPIGGGGGPGGPGGPPGPATPYSAPGSGASSPTASPSPEARFSGGGASGALGTGGSPSPPPGALGMIPEVPIGGGAGVAAAAGFAFAGPPDYWTIPGGVPPPSSEADPRIGSVSCPGHAVALRTKWVSYGSSRAFLRWECPVGPHLPWG